MRMEFGTHRTFSVGPQNIFGKFKRWKDPDLNENNVESMDLRREKCNRVLGIASFISLLSRPIDINDFKTHYSSVFPILYVVEVTKRF